MKMIFVKLIWTCGLGGDTVLGFFLSIYSALVVIFGTICTIFIEAIMGNIPVKLF